MHFSAPDMRFFVLSEEHVHDYLHLGYSFIWLELVKLFLLLSFGVL